MSKFPNWEKEEDKYLLENYETVKKERIIQKIGRTWSGIKRRAQKLGLNRANHILKFWKADEEELLKKLYPLAEWKDIINGFPKRKISNIYEKANNLGIHRFIHAGRKKVGKEMFCRNCKKSFYQPPSRFDRPYCSQKCSLEYMAGENAPTWKGGKSFEPYPPTFCERFKRSIRERDRNICAVCKKYGKDVHHIDYCKANTIPENCITLCRSCHIRIHSLVMPSIKS